MPIYEFFCEICGPFEQRRNFAQASEPLACPACQTQAARVYSAPGLYKTSPNERVARSRNEKSAHEPRVEQRNLNGETLATKPPQHHHPAHHHEPHRPWMIGH